MAQQTINIGSSANDGTGDTIRDAFYKVNANFTELYAVPGYASVQRAANQSIANGGTTGFSWDVEVADNNSIWSAGAPTRFTVSGTGNMVATISATVNFAANATGYRRLLIYKNGSSTGRLAAYNVDGSASFNTFISVYAQIPCVNGDYFEIVPSQASGGALNATGYADILISQL